MFYGPTTLNSYPPPLSFSFAHITLIWSLTLTREIMAPTQNLFLVAIAFAVIFTASTVHGRHNGAEDIVHSSCEHASYPSLCVRTLSSYSGPTITNRRDLAQAAIKISLSHAQSAAKKLAVVRDSVGKKKQEKAALVDCVEMIGDSVDELSRTLGVLKHLRVSGGSAKEFRWQMSNAQTWASAALTDDDTCLDGFQGMDDGEIKTEVKQWMTKVARVTSNALYMVNQLDETRGKPHDVHL
ncbi:Plant invertase/pectin methylesterase inhibitor superfamily protein [Arabidopsis thaliana]|nr:Plant invertase/pectin methylesterase inhibitor superfamily protein [Arabidopsis thaliana]ANM70403.1 Plant invertase/pectin methylesterase inhibitor superfamily protein [Arabidopsis thaliana]|eukprot:NP_001332017.1 Plant invertase/pectin methylesterase inhibitor superfamily protein [Arabidopsis thaliana]